MDQLVLGKPLTVTDPNMTRFMMSLDQSVDLVLYAFEHARPGDIFVDAVAHVPLVSQPMRRNPVAVDGLINHFITARELTIQGHQ